MLVNKVQCVRPFFINISRTIFEAIMSNVWQSVGGLDRVVSPGSHAWPPNAVTGTFECQPGVCQGKSLMLRFENRH